jgi:serine/threonine protein kinase
MAVLLHLKRLNCRAPLLDYDVLCHFSLYQISYYTMYSLKQFKCVEFYVVLFVSDTLQDTELILHEELARGAFGVVYRGEWRGRTVAVKRLLIALSSSSDDERRNSDTSTSTSSSEYTTSFSDLCNEANIMSTLQHDNIVQLFGFALFPALGAYLRNTLPTHVTWRTRRHIALDVARALAFMHAHSMLHRDLRSPNVFLLHVDDAERDVAIDAGEAVAKVSDFGLSRRVAARVTESLESWPWMAPETRVAVTGAARSGIVSYDERADVYSFAMVMMHLHTHRLPFSEYGDRQDHEIERDIVRSGLRPSLDSNSAAIDTPHAALQLIRDCWQTDPHSRPLMRQVVDRLGNI